MRYLLIVLLLTGCSSIKMERGAEGTADYEKIVVRAPPKDFRALNFRWHDTQLRAGEAATAEQPWADVATDSLEVIQAVMFCRQNPGLCNK